MIIYYNKICCDVKDEDIYNQDYMRLSKKSIKTFNHRGNRD